MTQPIFHAVVRRKRLAIVKTHQKQHSTYQVLLLKRNKQPAKRQPVEFNKLYRTAGDAKHDIRLWNMAAI